MKNVTLVIIGGLLFSCITQDNKDLNGVWKFVSGNYTFSDTSMFISGNINLKSIKIYSDSRYSLITQNEVDEYFNAHSGLYSIEGNVYTEMFKIHKDPDMIGKSATFKYQVIGNQLVISSDYLTEVWEKVE